MIRSWCLCLVAVSCVACNDEAPRGGLVLMVVQDGSLKPDTLRLAYGDPGEPANEARWDIPEEAELPLTITLEAKQGSAPEVTIDGSLWSDDWRLDGRTFTVSNIPRDRYAAVELLFGARCSLTAAGAPECRSGQTCDPQAGTCVSQFLDAATLPDYEPDLETTITWDPPGGQDAGTTSVHEAGVSLSIDTSGSEASEGSNVTASQSSSQGRPAADGGAGGPETESSSGGGTSTSATSESSTGAPPSTSVSLNSETRVDTSEVTGHASEPNPTSTSPTSDSATGEDTESDTEGPVCTDGDYWHDGACVPWDICGAGYYVLVEGTDYSNRICEPCAPETFSLEDNVPACTPFTQCGFREQEDEGSPSQDVTCAEGDVVFQYGSEEGDTASAVAVDSDGSVYVVGYTDGETFSPNVGNWDAFIQKRTVTGDVAWSEQFGTSSYDRAQGVVVNANGDITVVGSTEGNLARAPGLADLFLRRYKPNGDVAWTSQYGTPNLDMAYSIAETAAGSLVVTGRTYGTLSSGNNPNGADFFVSSFSATGAHEWSQQIGDSEEDYRGSSITVDAAGDIVAVGNTVAGFGGDDVTIIKVTAAGVIDWVYSFGSNAQDVPTAVAADEEGNIFVAGYSYGKLGANDPQGVDAWVSKRNSEGDMVWIDQFGSNVEDAALAVVIHGSSLYVAGQWGNESDLADDQVFVRRYNLDGTAFVSHVFGSIKPEYGYGLAVATDRIFVTGDTSGDFGGTNAGRYDAFLTQVVLP